jgi:hypothetical protein
LNGLNFESQHVAVASKSEITTAQRIAMFRGILETDLVFTDYMNLVKDSQYSSMFSKHSEFFQSVPPMPRVFGHIENSAAMRGKKKLEASEIDHFGGGMRDGHLFTEKTWRGVGVSRPIIFDSNSAHNGRFGQKLNRKL